MAESKSDRILVSSRPVWTLQHGSATSKLNSLAALSKPLWPATTRIPVIRHVGSQIGLRARFFPARILAFRLDATLLRARRGRSSFFAASAFVGAEALPSCLALVRRDGFEAAGTGTPELLVSAISSPNKAATSLSASTFAAVGADFDIAKILPGAGQQFGFIDAAQHEEQLRLFVEPGADAVERRRTACTCRPSPDNCTRA